MRGFTLIELAVVVAVVALLLGTLVPTFATRNEARQANETRAALAEIKEALTGFAAIYGRLPCPDTDADGLENRSGAFPFTCAAFLGTLPYRDLGTAHEDVWSQPFQYQVTQEFTYASIPGMPASLLQLDLQDAGSVTVQVRDQTFALVNATTTSAARVWSTGREDLQVWLSPHVIQYRMLLAHRLP